jgi:hypothetical protein
MSDRERKRAQRQKRKRRTAQSGARPGVGRPDPGVSTGRLQRPGPDAQPPAVSSRSEARDADARAALEPLHEGERPRIVTAAAVISVVASLLSVAGWVLWDVLRDDPRPPIGGVVVFVALFGSMAWGLWGARYWAVLGFQTVLVFTLVLSSLAIVQATTVLQAVGDVVIIALAGFLFYRMIKAMARIQMPERLPRE